MIANLRNWFLALSRREQWLVALAGGLAAWVLLIFGIILPAMAAIDSAKLELDEAVQRRGRIEATVENAAQQKSVGPQASSSDIDLIVTQSATEQGFDLLKSASAGPGQISFRIDQARAPALLAWLSGLEAQKPAGTQASSSDIDLVVTQSATEQGFDLLKSASAGPGQISFRIDQARAPALLAWLSGLEAQNIEVVSISLRGGTSGSLTVDAQLRRTGQ